MQGSASGRNSRGKNGVETRSFAFHLRTRETKPPATLAGKQRTTSVQDKIKKDSVSLETSTYVVHQLHSKNRKAHLLKGQTFLV